MPTVSVVMPVYNGARFLRQAIESVLGQTFSDLEFLIVDDGSTDDTRGIVQSYRDKRIRLLVNDRNLGITESLNKGITAASGKFVGRMDADDVAREDRFEKQIEFLERNPTVALVGANCILIDGSGIEVGRENYPDSTRGIMRRIFIHNPFAHSSVTIRSDIIARCGMYDQRFLHNEDYDLWLRIASGHEVRNLEDFLILRRVHEANLTVEKETELTLYRIRTLFHAAVNYYHKPLYLIFLVRPLLAYLSRLVKGMSRH